MKRIITLSLCVFFLNSLSAQKLDYDNDSKWFWGINVGATWNTTDVKNKTHIGWGLTLGRAFNYNYGKKFSFDLRLRYLGGNWYGQDYDTTHVIGNSNYDPTGSVATIYDTASPGYTINNFQTEAHQLGLELVLHANSLREKTGFDPYIFGGANLVWNQTYGDLYAQDTINSGFYNYAPSGMSKSEWNNMSDDIYDSPLDGSTSSYKVNFHPSLGIGFQYYISPRFAVGVEHKTTFALANTFDGYAGDNVKWGISENDLYHYTSAFLRFGIKGKKNTEIPPTVDPGDPTVSGLTEGGCLTPSVVFNRPNKSITVNAREYDVEAVVKHVAGRNNIQYTINGTSSTNFDFNASNGSFKSKVLLTPGKNVLVIKAGNACGNGSATVTINFDDCVEPEVKFTNPTAKEVSVDKAQFVVTASIKNADNIQYQVNGLNSNNFANAAGDFSSNLTLKEGVNTIRIIANNECGTDEKVIKINFTTCAEPYVGITGGRSLSVDQPTYDLKATVGNVGSKSDIKLTVNGTSKDFVYNVNSKELRSTIALQPGINKIIISASNLCGNDSETITINYKPCEKPIISMLVPTSTNLNTTVSNQEIKAKITNVASRNDIVLTLNGAVVSGGSYSSTTQIFRKMLTLVPGLNTITLTASTECGTSTKTIKIQYRGGTTEPPVEEEKKIKICHYPAGGGNPQEMEILLSDWPAHQAHGDKLGPCPIVNEPPVEDKKITICHYPPGNTDNPQQLEIPLSAWPAHQAHGDKLGPCPDEPEPVEEEKITICHYPPGNIRNPQQIEIPLSAWPAHQAHGDKLGPCPDEPAPVEEEKITICHYPPGNKDNPQQIEIPLSAWPAHQAHGDKLGPCPTKPEPVEEEKIKICHYPPGNKDNPQQIEIPLSAWPAHQAHGDKLGPCPEKPEPNKPSSSGDPSHGSGSGTPNNANDTITKPTMGGGTRPTTGSGSGEDENGGSGGGRSKEDDKKSGVKPKVKTKVKKESEEKDEGKEEGK